jgi:enoyl-CoA hydratase/carnithine racemase
MEDVALHSQPLVGARLQVVELPTAGEVKRSAGVILLGVHRGGARPGAVAADFDLLMTQEADAPRPWVSVADLDGAIGQIEQAVARNPVAAEILTQSLRVGEGLPFGDALVVESLAYSTLLSGAEFKAWRAATPIRARPQVSATRVRVARKDGRLVVSLARGGARNAVDAAMRDALVEALEFALEDPEQAPVLLIGEGPCFSAGGDLDEFGRATDLAVAHAIRVGQSPASLLHALGSRAEARLHGACIGAGIEIPAAAALVTVTSDAWLQLPEVSMGLAPGAGGTVTIPRRIGRERACFMALSGLPIDAVTALAWGLADRLEPAP